MILMFFVCSVLLISYLKILSGIWLSVAVLGMICYIGVFGIGILFRIGPFKYITDMILDDVEAEKEARKSRQPWE